MDLYDVYSKTSTSTSHERFQLHMHLNYEIYLFLEGDAKYIVEENVYPLSPGDIIVIRKNTLHRVYLNNDAKYSRMVMNIHPDFFTSYDCPEYEAHFLLSSPAIGNKIDADVAKKCGLYDALMRIKKYSNDFSDIYSPVIKALIIEVLFILNNIASFSKGVVPDKQLSDIISYINRNFTKNISLNDIEKEFFISKYHLCHKFHEFTGLTVHQYITDKRLAMAKDLLKDGLSLGEAAFLSGFNNYSSFYRAYKKMYGSSPNSNY